MTIRKGELWEQPLEPGDLERPVFSSDASLAAAVSTGVRVARVESGDLLRTLGLVGTDRAEPRRFSMDLGWVELDGGDPRPFVAHVIARRPLWRGSFVTVMNAAWLGELYLGPRAHPNDGLADITLGALAWRQRLQARQRARSGTHLPHPDLATRRVEQWTHRFDRRTPVSIDGVSAGSTQALSLRIESDAFILVA